MKVKANLLIDSHKPAVTKTCFKHIIHLLVAFLAVCMFLLTAWEANADLVSQDNMPISAVLLAVPKIVKSESLPGGETTVSLLPFPSSMLPAKNLPESKRALFHAGKALAHQPWIKAPTTTDARDGLGPIYNARTCLACHINGGRGRLPNDSKTVLFNSVIRLSIPDLNKRYKDSKSSKPKSNLEQTPEPKYGSQLQTQSVSLAHQLRTHISESQLEHKEVAPEAYAYIDWQNKEFMYPDGEVLSLRFPKLNLENLNYGKLHPKTLFSLRNAPPLHGVGLIEQIAQKDIDVLIDPDDLDNNDISGRINYIKNPETKKLMPGRFGLKANEGDLRLQTAAAFVNDVGITNPVFPKQPCTDAQTLCNSSATGNDPKTGVEISEELLLLTTNFIRGIGVPNRRNENDEEVKKGRTLFYQSGCQECHKPSYLTQKTKEFPHLSKQKIWPYSDFLLHDMGKGLADGRPDFSATGNEWRTPPLWGVGLSKKINGSDNLLHDGRARNVEEAILWHGGEAEKIKQAFTRLNKKSRQALVKFVESL